jgi:hypothetical protein
MFEYQQAIPYKPDDQLRFCPEEMINDIGRKGPSEQLGRMPRRREIVSGV